MDLDSLAQLCALGFPRDTAAQALRSADNDVGAAALELSDPARAAALEAGLGEWRRRRGGNGGGNGGGGGGNGGGGGKPPKAERRAALAELEAMGFPVRGLAGALPSMQCVVRFLLASCAHSPFFSILPW